MNSEFVRDYVKLSDFPSFIGGQVTKLPAALTGELIVSNDDDSKKETKVPPRTFVE